MADLKVFQQQIELSKNKFLVSNPESEQKALKIFEREKGFALMQVMNNQSILKCSEQSFYTAIAMVALTGISLNPALKLAYLVPRGGKAILDISYMGMIEILRNSGSVKSMRANCVFEGDEFDYNEGLGTDYYLKHKVVLNRPDNAKIIAAYSVATLENGSETFFLMDYKKLMQHKKIAMTKNIWEAWEEEMCIKTVIRQHYKFLPKTEKATSIMENFDNQNPVDYSKTNEVVETVADDVTDLEIALSDIKSCQTIENLEDVKIQFLHLSENKDFQKAISEKQKTFSKDGKLNL